MDNIQIENTESDRKNQSVTEFQSNMELQKMYHYDIHISDYGGIKIVQFISKTHPDIKTYGERVFGQEDLHNMNSKLKFTSFILSMSKPLDDIEGFSKTIQEFLRYSSELKDEDYENSVPLQYTRRFECDNENVCQVIDGNMVKKYEQNKQQYQTTFDSLTSEEIREGQLRKRKDDLLSIIQQLKASLYDDEGHLYASNLYGGGAADKQNKLNLLRYYEEQLNRLDNELSNLNNGKKR